MSLYKLNNVIQPFAWGSRTAMSQLFGVENSNNEPQAELWMGAHPGGCSVISESGQLLSDFIGQNKVKALGEYTESRFGELPFLFKVLAAQTPLSIQVHPNKRNAEIGFNRENASGIDLNAFNRNYKDQNHKPELVYALTPYRAMNGFRPIMHIVQLFKEIAIPSLSEEVAELENLPNKVGLKKFFSSLMTLESERKQSALRELKLAYQKTVNSQMAREALKYSKDFSVYYEDDIGLFSPLFLNTLELEPGEAMFLDAQTPHAYVKGTALEIMANSDNVLRAGLTPKHIDVEELIDNTIFEPIFPESIKLQPIIKQGREHYPVPVDDFGFEILTAKEEGMLQYVRGAEIVFCIHGEVTINVGQTGLTLKSGESAFITNSSLYYQYAGKGKLARAYN